MKNNVFHGFKKVFFSFILASMIVLILISAISLILPHLSSGDKISLYLSYTLRFLLCFMTAFICAKNSKGGGALTGVTIGLLFFVLMLFVGLFQPNTGGILETLKDLFIYIACGVVGGVIGINI